MTLSPVVPQAGPPQLTAELNEVMKMVNMP